MDLFSKLRLYENRIAIDWEMTSADIYGLFEYCGGNWTQVVEIVAPIKDINFSTVVYR